MMLKEYDIKELRKMRGTGNSDERDTQWRLTYISSVLSDVIKIYKYNFLITEINKYTNVYISLV